MFTERHLRLPYSAARSVARAPREALLPRCHLRSAPPLRSPIRSPFNIGYRTAITPPAALCEGISVAYSLFFIGFTRLLYHTIVGLSRVGFLFFLFIYPRLSLRPHHTVNGISYRPKPQNAFRATVARLDTLIPHPETARLNRRRSDPPCGYINPPIGKRQSSVG